MATWTPIPLLAALPMLRAPVGVSVYMRELSVAVLTLIIGGGAMVWEYPDAGSDWIRTVRSQSWPL